jgi:hypothetical protein
MDNREILARIAGIRSSFNDNFENPWFFMLLEGIPIDPILLKDLRDFIRIEEIWAADENRATQGIRNFEIFILTLRRYLIPCIKERLRISNLKPESLVRDRDQLAIRKLVAYSVPLKVSILDDLVKSFKLELGAETGEIVMEEVSA